jgi:hypothetical protein
VADLQELGAIATKRAQASLTATGGQATAAAEDTQGGNRG